MISPRFSRIYHFIGSPAFVDNASNRCYERAINQDGIVPIEPLSGMEALPDRFHLKMKTLITGKDALNLYNQMDKQYGDKLGANDLVQFKPLNEPPDHLTTFAHEVDQFKSRFQALYQSAQDKIESLLTHYVIDRLDHPDTEIETEPGNQLAAVFSHKDTFSLIANPLYFMRTIHESPEPTAPHHGVFGPLIRGQA